MKHIIQFKTHFQNANTLQNYRHSDVVLFRIDIQTIPSLDAHISVLILGL